MINWPTVTPYSDGTPITEDNLNLNTIIPIINRTDILKGKVDILEEDGTLSGIRLTGQADLPEPGNIVYWEKREDGTWGWGKALARATDYLYTTTTEDSSFAVGICESATTVLLVGSSKTINLTNVKLQPGEDKTSGAYYLSATHPGCVTRNRPEVAVYVGVFLPGASIINPAIRDNADAHTHHSFKLSSNPVGTTINAGTYYDPEWKLVGFRHDGDSTSSEPDYATLVVYRSLQGPKIDKLSVTLTVSSTGSAVMGLADLLDGTGEYVTCAFNEQFSEDDDIYGKAVFIDGIQSYIYFIKPEAPTEDNTGTIGTLTYVVGDAGSKLGGWVPVAEGIGLFDQLPGALDTRTPVYAYNIGFDKLVGTNYPPVPLSNLAITYNGTELYESSKVDLASYGATYSTILWLDRAGRPWAWEGEGAWSPKVMLHTTRRAAGGTGVVTSIVSGERSPIKFRAAGTPDTASTGDLEAYLDLILHTEDNNEPGHLVVKASQDNQLLLGPVVEKISLPPNSGLHISRNQGDVQISLEQNQVLTGSFGSVDLQNAKQARNGMFTYITIPASRQPSAPTYAFNSSFQLPYKKPIDGSGEDAYKVRISATVFGDRGTTGDETASLVFSYAILPDDYHGEKLVSILEANNAKVDNNVTVTFKNNYKAYDPFRISTGGDEPGELGMDFPAGELVVSPGDTVGIRIETGTGEATYTGNVCFLSLRYELIPV